MNECIVALIPLEYGDGAMCLSKQSEDCILCELNNSYAIGEGKDDIHQRTDERTRKL